jgi:hypothetical protein
VRILYFAILTGLPVNPRFSAGTGFAAYQERRLGHIPSGTSVGCGLCGLGQPPARLMPIVDASLA